MRRERSERLAALAKRLVAQPINYGTWCDRSELVRRESLLARLVRARIDGNERHIARLERAIERMAGRRA